MRVPRSGLSYAPSLEWRLAARWGHYTWEAFEALEGDDQAAVVAAYRCDLQMQAVVAHEETKAARRAARRRRAKGRPSAPSQG